MSLAAQLKANTNNTGTYVIAVGPSARSCSRKRTEWLACQGRLWSLLAVTLKLNHLSSSSPCVGKWTGSWDGTVHLSAVVGQQRKTSVVLVTCDRSVRVVYLTCVMRIHSYMNSVAITRTKVPFVEEGKAYWETNKMLILLHVSSTLSQTCQCKSRCDGTKVTRLAFLPTSKFY